MTLKSAVMSAWLFTLSAVVVLAQTPRQVSLVITNGIVVTVDGGNRVIDSGAVAIDGTDIVAVDTTRTCGGSFADGRRSTPPARW
jgi:hypothetical protein